jgi:FixJ family two-component response regulator
MSEQSLVYVIDDDPSMRDLIRTALHRAGVNCTLFGSAEEAMARGSLEAEALGPRCLLLDLEMPGTPGLAFLEKLRDSWQAAGYAGWPVIVVTAKGSIRAAVQSMKMGAVDFIEKPIEVDGLVKLVQETLLRHAAALAETEERSRVRERIARLSARERQLLDAIVGGQSTKMIADKLGISARTVDHHRANLMQKMRAENVADLVRIAVGADYTSV